MSSGLRTILQPISAEMELVEAGMRQAVSSGDAYISALLGDTEEYKGKRLRPALVILSGKCIGGIDERHIKLAIAVELIHTAALVHDDIIDGATLRRNRPTTCHKWGPEISVVLGDFLLSRAFCLISSLNSLEVTRIALETTQAMCEGELRQLARRYDFDLKESDYFWMIEKKTAVLWAASCRLGAMLADAKDGEADMLGAYGLHVGTAFQIIDDCLDLIGKEAVTGKTMRTDICKGKLTLPLIHLSTHIDPSQKNKLRDLVRKAEHGEGVEQLMGLLAQYGSIDYSMQRAESCVKEACDGLNGLRSSPHKEQLLTLADYVIHRRR